MLEKKSSLGWIWDGRIACPRGIKEFIKECRGNCITNVRVDVGTYYISRMKYLLLGKTIYSFLYI